MLFKKRWNIRVRSTAMQCERRHPSLSRFLCLFLFLTNRHPAFVRFCSRKLSSLMVSQHPKVIISLSSLIAFAQLIFSFAFSPFFLKKNKKKPQNIFSSCCCCYLRLVYTCSLQIRLRRDGIWFLWHQWVLSPCVVTPKDYQPPGFKEDGSPGDLFFDGEPVNLRVGSVSTGFHLMKVRVTTEKKRMGTVESNLIQENGPTEISHQGLDCDEEEEEWSTKV